MQKSIVVYFSRGDEEYGVGEVHPGNTELLAKEIIRQTGADEFKIEPVVAYPASYMECVEVAAKERESGVKPAYRGEVELANHEVIYLGYPIWWEDVPPIVKAFLDNHDLSNKTIVPFNTHEGSGNAGTYEKLKQRFPDANFTGDGFNMTGTMARSARGIQKLNNWLDSLQS